MAKRLPGPLHGYQYLEKVLRENFRPSVNCVVLYLRSVAVARSDTGKRGRSLSKVNYFFRPKVLFVVDQFSNDNSAAIIGGRIAPPSLAG